MISKRIALGTVQFGLKYGINNTHGVIGKSEAFDILKYAAQNGLDTLDTATAYGDAELRLGEFFLENKDMQFKVISKLPPKSEISDKHLIDSVQKLHIKKLYAYLAHDFEMFHKDIDLIKKFLALKETGLTEKIGFSLYYVEDLKFLLNNNIAFDIIQISYNVFDQRFGDWFQILKEKGIEIHVRSCFLQGLVFMDPDKLPTQLSEFAPKLRQLRSISDNSNMPINSLCIGFCLSNPAIDKLVIGIDSLDDLKLNCMNMTENPGKKISDELHSLKETNEKLILPVNWQL